MKGTTLAIALALGLLPPAAEATQQWRLSAAAWARPRTGMRVLTMQPLPEVVRTWAAQPDGRIVIRYPGGAEGELWAAQLTGWLVALGVPPSAIEQVPGARPATLELVVTGRGS